MQPAVHLTRTSTNHPDFQALVRQLDHELWNELNEDQATYDQHNKVPGIDTAVVLYAGELPVACGCFKTFDATTAEIKRMFVVKTCRGKGYSRQVLQALEQWAAACGFSEAVLETSIHFSTARRLYESSGYVVIPNYPPYVGLPESLCLKKELQ